jgi:predicted GIY-YIG superfamily endonuclease
MNTVRAKKYQGHWKINLAERNNPHWNDLYMTLAV